MNTETGRWLIEEPHENRGQFVERLTTATRVHSESLSSRLLGTAKLNPIASIKRVSIRQKIATRRATRYPKSPMTVVVLDGLTLNPGDLSWDDLRALGHCDIFDRTPATDVLR